MGRQGGAPPHGERRGCRRPGVPEAAHRHGHDRAQGREARPARPLQGGHPHGHGLRRPGRAALALPDLYADERGVARLWITLPTAAGQNLASTGNLLDVHAVDAGGNAVAGNITCGAIKAPATKAAARVKPSVAGGTVKGFVAAKQDGASLKVEIHLRGLVPGSAHAQHIHSGSCDAMGPIVVPFADAVADADGDYDAT